MLEQAGAVETRHERRWNGRFAEVSTYRWASELPLRASDEALRVNWLELTLTRADTAEVLYHTTWVTNHPVTAASVAALAKVGRARWKIENAASFLSRNIGTMLMRRPTSRRCHEHQTVTVALTIITFVGFRPSPAVTGDERWQTSSGLGGKERNHVYE